jgi:hypothetical protein
VIRGLDADCGVVLDRRRFPSLGPDGSGEGPQRDRRRHRGRGARQSPGRVFGSRRDGHQAGDLGELQPALSTGEDPTVDLVVGLDRFGPNYGPGGVIETPTERFGVVSAFIVAQGPNYALAKRLQRWQMIATRADGILTSVHVAPPTPDRLRARQPAHGRAAAADRITWGSRPSTRRRRRRSRVRSWSTTCTTRRRRPTRPPRWATRTRRSCSRRTRAGRWRVPFDVGSTVPLLHEVTAARLRGGTVVRPRRADADSRGVGRVPWREASRQAAGIGPARLGAGGRPPVVRDGMAGGGPRAHRDRVGQGQRFVVEQPGGSPTRP